MFFLAFGALFRPSPTYPCGYLSTTSLAFGKLKEAKRYYFFSVRCFISTFPDISLRLWSTSSLVVTRFASAGGLER